MCKDPKKCKKTDHLTVFFALLGSARVKASYEMLMIVTPDVHVDHESIDLSTKIIASPDKEN